MDKTILQKWLAASFMEAGSLHDTESGTPQGGVASPVLANFALNGMQKMLTDLIPHGTGSRRGKAAKINFIRYADDFVTTGATPEFLRETVQPAVERFLAERGLTLSTDKTKITHIADGYDFLGFTIRRFGRQLLVRPSNASQRSLLKKVRGEVGAPVCGTVTTCKGGQRRRQRGGWSSPSCCR